MFKIIVILIAVVCSGYTIISGNVEIYRIDKHGQYSVLYGKREEDTIAFAIRTILIETCGKPKFVSIEGLKTIMSLDQFDGPDIIFTYTGSSINGFPKGIRVGGGAPGQWNKLYVDTYYQYPYLIEDCKSFKEYQ